MRNGILRFKGGIIALAVLLAQTACVSMSSLQTAETLEKGKTEATFGGGTYNSQQTTSAGSASFQIPYLEASYREGLASNLDAGIKVTLIGSLAADVKYRFLHSGGFDAAVGGGLGYMSYSSGSGDTQITNSTYDAMIPIYASYRFVDWLALYGSPRYVFQMNSLSGAASGTTNSSLVGGAGGVKIGKNWGVYLEAAYQKDVSSNYDFMQYNVSFFWGGEHGVLAQVGL